MPQYRRAKVAGGTFFFTLVTYRRRPLFLDARARALLGHAFRECLTRQPFGLDAIVLLPDHLHAIWSLPPGDLDFSGRWSRIKRDFTRGWLSIGGREIPPTAGKRRERRRGVWQPRFWEHTIEAADDFDRHFDYLHYNPKKHGLVDRVCDWPHSSFHRWVRSGVYPSDWGGGPVPATAAQLEQTTGEPCLTLVCECETTYAIWGVHNDPLCPGLRRHIAGEVDSQPDFGRCHRIREPPEW